MNVIKELQIWYASHCNGEWEHSFGVGIDTLDNPGWWVKINLTGTELEGRKFQPIRHGISDDEKSTESEWMTCQVKREWKHRGQVFILDIYRPMSYKDPNHLQQMGKASL